MYERHTDHAHTGHRPSSQPHAWIGMEVKPRLQTWMDAVPQDRSVRAHGRFDRQIEADVLRNLARLGL